MNLSSLVAGAIGFILGIITIGKYRLQTYDKVYSRGMTEGAKQARHRIKYDTNRVYLPLSGDRVMTIRNVRVGRRPGGRMNG